MKMQMQVQLKLLELLIFISCIITDLDSFILERRPSDSFSWTSKLSGLRISIVHHHKVISKSIAPCPWQMLMSRCLQLNYFLHHLQVYLELSQPKATLLDLKLENWQFEQKGTCLKIHIVNAQILESVICVNWRMHTAPQMHSCGQIPISNDPGAAT